MTTKTIARNPKLIKKLEEIKFREENLCEAHKLLVKRMESNPDEFYLQKGGKWADYLNLLHQRIKDADENILVMLDTAECEYVWNKYKEVAKNNLHRNFMKRILRADEQEDTPEIPNIPFATRARRIS